LGALAEEFRDGPGGAMSSINHHREGAGPPLVLLHGIGHHWQAWRPAIGPLAADFDVIACDSPGFGGSAPLVDGIEPTIPAYAEAFERFFEELGLARPHVAGNSMGGAIALELARRGVASSVTALSPAGFWTPAELRFCQASLGALARTPKAARPLLVALTRTRAGRLALFWQLFGWPAQLPIEEAVAGLRAAWAAPAFSRALAAFSQYTFGAPGELDERSVTIAWGEHDRLLPYRRQAPRARAMLPGARHVTLGAGHVPFYDDPAAVAEVIGSGARAAERSRSWPERGSGGSHS
jgi:pimeloyl-ACP methyl ester carboxylesterase